MEGILSVWTNVLVGWKPKYFILHDCALIFCDHKGGQKKGSIHLKIATISSTPDDPLRIIINTGTSEMHLKAGSLQEKISWTNALKDAHEEAKQKDLRKKQDSLTNGSSLATKSRMLADTKSNMFNDRLSQLASLQTEFDESLKLFVQKVAKINGLKELAGKLESIGVDMKQRVSVCINEIEDEKASLLTVIDYLESKKGGRENLHPQDRLINYDKYEEQLNGRKSYGTPMRNSPNYDVNYNGGGQDADDEDNESFYSFAVEDGYLHMPGMQEDEEEEKINGGRMGGGGHQGGNYRGKSNSGASLNELSLTIPRNNLSRASGTLGGYHPIIKMILDENVVFKNFQIPNTATREKLPHLRDPNEKFPIWSFLKDMIGKDLSKFTMPVWMNEPLSFLQRLCEQIEHVYLLEKANTFSDSCLRLAYVCAFALTPYLNTATRHKKPFNPLLGETYEYIPPDKSFRFIGEQVSHHPPISAGYAESPAFELWSDSNVKSGLKGTTIEVRPLGSTHAVLKKHKDHFTFRRPITTVGGIIFGSVYVDNHGEVIVTNHTTKDVAVMHLKSKGWTEKGMGDFTGTITDATGKLRYKLIGNTNRNFKIIDPETNQETLIFEKPPLPEDYARMFGFNHFAIQLNHLSKDMLNHLAPTDSRLRPDQRAWEQGLSELASSEKHRLEEKQRARRKLYEATGRVHEPKWFKEIIDPITNEKSFIYTGGYWENRETQNFPDILDIYTDQPV